MTSAELRPRNSPSCDSDHDFVVKSWGGVLTEYASYLVAAGRARKTRRLRKYYARCFAEFTRRAPSRVTLDDLTDYLAANPQWAPATRHVAQVSLRDLFGWMHRTGRRRDNPAAMLPRVRVPAGVPRPCPDDAIIATMAAVGEREALMLRLGSEAGLRRGEIATTRGDKVEQAIGGYTLTVTGKGGKTRTVPIGDGLARAILARGPGWTFPGRTDGHLCAERVGNIMSEALPGHWTAHTLRHRYGSAAYAGDHDIRAVQELLGHASVATTQIYTRVPDEAKRKAASAAALAA